MANLRILFLTLCAASTLMYFMFTFLTGREEEVFEPSEPEFRQICKEIKKNFIYDDKYNKVVYFITPTYPRPEQIPELTRLSQTLKHVANLHWIVADDRDNCNPVVVDFLQYSDLSFTYMISPMPAMFRKVTYVPRGVSNRRAGMEWIRKYAASGVMYFGDDDNTYDLRLFDEIKSTIKVSMFPVGLVGEYGVSSPVLRRGHVVGFYDSWTAERKYPVDMAGFAMSVPFFLSTNGTMPYKAGHEEDLFLKSLQISYNDIEPKAEGCTKLYVWHTRTAHTKVKSLKNPSFKSSNIAELLQEVSQQGISIVRKRQT